MDNKENRDFVEPPEQPSTEPALEPAQQAVVGRKVIQPLEPSPNAEPAPLVPPEPKQVDLSPQAVPPQPSVTPAVISGAFTYDETATSSVSTAPVEPVQTYLTGSQLAQEKQPIPKGIYVLVGWNVIGLISTFLDSSQASELYTFGLLLALLVTVGLLFRLEAIRKFYIGLSVLMISLAVITIVGVAMLQARYHKAQKNYEAAVTKLDTAGRVSVTQKQKLTELDKKLTEQSKKADKGIAYTYVTVGAGIAANATAIIYLTRPGVKEAFRDLES